MTEFVTLPDGCRIAWRSDGPAGAPPVVLSNSLGTSMEMWAPQVGPLSQHFRVIRYDKRGHGQSDAPPGAYSMDRLGRDVIELLDALEIERTHFLGLSIGGMTGQWLAACAPERLDRLILSNTGPYMGPPSNWQTRIDTVTRDGMGAIVDIVLNNWLTPSFREREPETVDRVRRMFTATNPVGYAGCCAAIRDMDLRPYAALNRTPTLVIAGDHDPATPPEKGQAIADAAQDARLVCLPAAHLSNLEKVQDFNTAVLQHLQ